MKIIKPQNHKKTDYIYLEAHAKLNLFLEIISQRADGYHELESQVVFLDLADEIAAKHSHEISIIGKNIKDNIVIKIARKINRKHRVKKGAEFSLKKNIPIGGGLGGGSADAAAAIVLLNELWELHLSNQEMYEFALEAGADVPICLHSILEDKNTAMMRGVGEKISSANFPDNKYFLLVNPNIELATSQIFKNTKLSSLKILDSDDYKERQNHLHRAAIKFAPQIQEIIEALEPLRGCELARMTGSGSTCFAIFENEEDAAEAEKYIISTHPDWWVCNTRLKSSA